MGEAELYRLFDSLQKAGFPLGINEYKLLLESWAQKEELGIKDRDALKRFCCALWVKSPTDRLRFEAHFDQIIPNEAEKTHKPGSGKASPPKWAKYAVILGGILLLSIGGFWAYRHHQPQKTLTKPTPTPISSPEQTSKPEFPQKPTPKPTPTSITIVEEADWLDEMTYFFLLTGAIAAGRWLIKWRRQKRSYLVALNPKSQIIATLPAQLTTDYFPFTARQMKQTWRYWRCLTRSGIPRELDVDATIRSISRQGFLLKPILQPRRVNRTQLLLLLDFQGSMIPFHSLSHQLAQTALEGGRFHQTLIYYFYNCPQGYLYRDPYGKEPVAIADVFKQLQPQYAGVLIVSDGGAIKGYFNQQRSQMTQQFLTQLRQSVRKICWLNPLPPSRWTETTAAAISQHVPMFELNRQGLEQAISVLRGVAR